MRLPIAVKPMLERVRNYVLLAGWLQQQFEQPNHWSLDSFSCGTYGLKGVVSRHYSSAMARYCNTAQLRTHRIEVFCRYSVAAARHLRRTPQRRSNLMVLSRHDASALYAYTGTMSQFHAVLVALPSDVATLHHCDVARLRVCDVIAFRGLSTVILEYLDAAMLRCRACLMV